MMKGSSILLVGTGAMASLFAALLSAKGYKVKMLGTWVENIKALNEKGVRLVDQNGHETIFPVFATNNPEACANSDFVLVLVKSYQTAKAAKNLSSCLAENGVVLTLQNGLGNYEILADTLGSMRVISGVTTLGATLIGPGSVRIGGTGSITIGYHERVQVPEKILGQTGLKIEIVKDTNSLIWGKLVINASINPLTALLALKNGGLLENSFARHLLELVSQESAGVSLAAGIELPYADPVKEVVAVARRTAENYSSMYIDFQRGGLTEIDAINGAIVRVGEGINMAVNYNRTLWLLVKAHTGGNSRT